MFSKEEKFENGNDKNHSNVRETVILIQYKLNRIVYKMISQYF